MTELELPFPHPPRETIVTIGVFDGVHRGHHHLITHLKEGAGESFTPVVVVLHPHPQAILSPNSPPLLTILPQRIKLIRKLGVELVFSLNTTQDLLNTSAADFVSLLKTYLKMRGLVVGPDFALGKDRGGNIAFLKELGKDMNFTVDVVPPFAVDGRIASSSQIRYLLSEGNVREAAKLLGHPVFLNGEVVHGEGRGRSLSFPTVNLRVDEHILLPGDGVYAARVRIRDDIYKAVANIGVRPTFGGKKRTVEAFMFDFEGEIYGESIELELWERLREERAFASPSELRKQQEIDARKAQSILRNHEQS
jgi:riboflavin kinase/FMN adenylyltransferase